MALREELREELAVRLYDVGALRFSDFEWTLKSGRQSPVYYNQRPLTSFGSSTKPRERDSLRKSRELIIQCMSLATDSLGSSYDHLYGIPQSGTAIGGMVAHSRGDSYLWGRVGAKDYGAHASTEGNFDENDTVVVLDDVITSAESKEEAAKDLEAAGLAVGGFVVTLDRNEGGAETIRKSGYQIVSCIGLLEAVRMLKENDRISSQEEEWVQQYREGLEEYGII